MADPRNTHGAPPREVHIEKKKTNWLAWILLAAGVLAALRALSRCHKRETVAAPSVTAMPAGAPATPPVAVQHITLPGGKVVDLEPKTLNYDLQAFLASSDPATRTSTASSQIRTDDQSTLSALSQILVAYPKSVIRLVGYADARGADAANTKLGSDRATAVAKALADGGIDARRISIASGVDSNPVASNDTAGGQFANRRTELVVTSK